MKIFAIGRNYTEHVRELSHDVPIEPVVFMKPGTALLRNNEPFFYPDFSSEIHYETELVVKICKTGRNIAPAFAHRYYQEIGIGIDFTARDLQRNFISKGLPWELSKSFDHSAPVSKFIPINRFPDLNNISFHLEINDQTVQKGNSSLMIFKVDELVCFISRFFTFKTGDLIFTGTPSGVGPVKPGDRLRAFLEDELMLDFFVK
jgi:2-keto-4-pentenoate hydratase/2-oxohepta-3-ene-1,7-dioic acid hydratase in catechol pathway